MGLVELIATVRSGVVKLTLERDRQVLGNATGFLVAGGLVTCSHTLPLDNCDTVVIGFDDQDDEVETGTIRLDARDVADMVRAKSDERENDYAFVACTEKEFEHRHKFEFVDSGVLEVGQQVAFLGFPFGSGHLTAHVGYISSLRKNGDFTVIQIDGSINNGNSGGPVLDLTTGKVAGLVTRSETGLIQEAFDTLLGSFDRNLLFIKQRTRRGLHVGGVDPVEAAEVTQTQLRQLAQHIRRSANVGIGFAFSTDALAGELSKRSAR